MKEAAIRQKLEVLGQVIRAGSRGPAGVQADAEGTYESQVVGKAPLTDVLDLLQLQLKYVIFDLEATRRENRYLRQLLESRPRRDFGEGDFRPDK